MADALENQLMLQRLFAGVTQPIERLGAGQLALAEQDMLRQQALADQARSIIIASQATRQKQAFEASENKKQRDFQAQLVKDQQASIEKREAARLKVEGEMTEKQIRLRQELEDDARKKVRDGMLDSNSAAYMVAYKMAQPLRAIIADASVIDTKEKNQIVRRVAERYVTDKRKLDTFLNPNSNSDISISLGRVVDSKKLADVQADIDRELGRLLEPKRMNAAFALEQLKQFNQQMVEAVSRGINPERLRVQGIDIGFGSSPVQEEMGPPAPPSAYDPASILNAVRPPGGAAAAPAQTPAPAAVPQQASVPPEVMGMVTPGGPMANAYGAHILPTLQAGGAEIYRNVASAFSRPSSDISPDYLGAIGNMIAAPFRRDFRPPQQPPAAPAPMLPIGREDVRAQSITPDVFSAMVALARADGLSEEAIKTGWAQAQQGNPRAIQVIQAYKDRALQRAAMQNYRFAPHPIPAQVVY